MKKGNHLEPFLLDRISIESNVCDVFAKDFDLTWMFNNHKEHINTKQFSIIPMERLSDGRKDEGDVLYVYNNENFRCDDFTSSHNGTHILFAGCSETEGVGGNLDQVWSKMLYDQLAEKNNLSGFFSIARSGYGWQKIITNAMIYFKKFGYPEYMFILLPQVGRIYEWNDSNKTYMYTQKYTESHLGRDMSSHDNLSKDRYFVELINFIISWQLFEEFCKSNNIKLLWTTWEHVDSVNIKNYNTFNNFFNLDPDECMKYINDQYVVHNKKIDKNDISKRDGHSGLLVNEYWLSIFKEQIRQKGWMNV